LANNVLRNGTYEKREIREKKHDLSLDQCDGHCKQEEIETQVEEKAKPKSSSNHEDGHPHEHHYRGTLFYWRLPSSPKAKRIMMMIDKRDMCVRRIHTERVSFASLE
jgi:hypothetical protein